ncbi:MAG: flagellar biosynthesis protein FliQ [Chloroflexota bacterium]|jgi:flagellar biosynthetic protein FliQ|nr:flagellar biosynthesis protein FliQ [Chloroflexota bacterium]
MNDMTVMELGRNAVMLALMLSAPMLLAALIIGLIVSVVQAVTQINEATLSFVPKILGVFAALAIAGPWMISTSLSYTVALFNMLPSMVR